MRVVSRIIAILHGVKSGFPSAWKPKPLPTRRSTGNRMKKLLLVGGAGFDDGRRPGTPNYARTLPVRHVAGRGDGGLDHQQARAFVGRGLSRRQPCARTPAAALLPDRRGPQTGRQDAPRRSCPGAATRDRLPLPDLFAGGPVVARRQQRHLRKDRRRRCGSAPGLRVPHLPGCGFRMLLPCAERHPRQGRLPDPALQAWDFSELGFVAFNGDMSSSVESGEQLFKAYLDASAALFAAETPILFTRGNHETRGVFADSLGIISPGRTGGSTVFIATATSASCSTAARTSPTTMRSTTGWPITTPTAPRSANG